MIFPSELIHSLESDHKKIKEYIKILKDQDSPVFKRHEAFDLLLPILSSHSIREERVVYSFMKSHSDLRAMATEGEQEHRVVDDLIQKIESESGEEVWSARTKILAELIEHHLKEEESEDFPALKGKLDREIDHRLCEQYERTPSTSSAPPLQSHKGLNERSLH